MQWQKRTCCGHNTETTSAPTLASAHPTTTVHMQVAGTRAQLWRARRTSTFEKNMSFASQGRIFPETLFSMVSRKGKQGCGEPHALAHCDKA